MPRGQGVYLLNYIETLAEPEGLTRTLGEIEVERGSHRVGNAAIVFKIYTGCRDAATGVFVRREAKMLKCYLRPVAHPERFEAIYGPRFLREELYVWDASGRGSWHDVVVDDWIDGVALSNSVNPASAFDALALDLLNAPWAHGDLKPENILADAAGRLYLIDWDAMFLPEFAGQRSAELGTPPWQHPARTEADFDRDIDDYSIALLSTTLHARALGAEAENADNPIPAEICLKLFERAGDAVHWRMAKLLSSPVMRLAELRELMEFAVRQKTDTKPRGGDAEGSLGGANGLWGFPGLKIPPIYTAAFDFTEGLAAVRTGRTWHFIDTAGRVAVDCSAYDAVKPFAQGRAVAVKGNKRTEIRHP